MSYCTLDEAFNTDFLNNQQQNCVKKQKVKRSKVNCNAKKNKFNQNKEDVRINTYDLSHNFDKGLLYEEEPSQNDYLQAFQTGLEKFDNYPSNNTRVSPPSQTIERFEGSPNNRMKVKRQNNNNNSDYNPGEIYESSVEDNRPLPESSVNYIIENSDDEEEEIIIKKRPKKKNKNNTNELNSQISEINNKISFIMNQINKEEEDVSNSNKSLENNIHDIILFVIFGAFIILLLESFFKFIIKIHTRD